RRFHRPGRLLMQLSDPSEAVESSAILETIRKCLEPILVRPYGGSVLHLLFDDIAHNFLRSDEETRQLLDLCFQTEDWALNSGQVASDFVFGVYKKAAGEAEATVHSSYYRH
ncbi:MAG: hypothetical protein ACOCSK_03045, partial [Rhodothermales bacterium]